MLEILYVRLAPIVYDLLDIMLLMPGMALLMISEILKSGVRVFYCFYII